jgi:L-lactate dehydrogenase complex protein LldG
MEESTTKEKILKEVRNALISQRENPFADIDFNKPVFHNLKEEPAIQFAMSLNDIGGQLVYCQNEKEIGTNLKLLMEKKNWKSVYSIDEDLVDFLKKEGVNVDDNPENFLDQQTGVTRCDFLISRFGSIMVSSGIKSGRRMFVFPETHIVVAATSQIVPELKDALKGMKRKYPDNFPSQVSVITGPSRTADIEKTLVMGAHGPKNLYVFLVDNG